MLHSPAAHQEKILSFYLFCPVPVKPLVAIGSSEVQMQTCAFKDIGKYLSIFLLYNAEERWPQMQPSSVSLCSHGLSFCVRYLTVLKPLSVFRVPFRLVIPAMFLEPLLNFWADYTCVPLKEESVFFGALPDSIWLCFVKISPSHKTALKEAMIHLDQDTPHGLERTCCKVQSGKTLSKFGRSSLQFSFNQHHEMQGRMLVRIHQKFQVSSDPRFLFEHIKIF